jgi:flavin reductase (DIM6/NTAB) family NADH-FMN oxidoreductase RutF
MDPTTLHKIGYGMYVVCSKKEEKRNGQIANALFQVTAEPATVAVSINKKNLTHEFIEASGVFTVSILEKEAPMKFIGNFGFKTGRNLDKFQGVGCKTGITGAPVVLDNTIGYFEAEVIDKISVGTHTVFIGKVVEAETLKEAEPMTYAYYHEVKKGLSPENAPTFIKKEK